jgi:hypothetical protein
MNFYIRSVLCTILICTILICTILICTILLVAFNQDNRTLAEETPEPLPAQASAIAILQKVPSGNFLTSWTALTTSSHFHSMPVPRNRFVNYRRTARSHPSPHRADSPRSLHL